MRRHAERWRCRCCDTVTIVWSVNQSRDICSNIAASCKSLLFSRARKKTRDSSWIVQPRPLMTCKVGGWDVTTRKSSSLWYDASPNPWSTNRAVVATKKKNLLYPRKSVSGTSNDDKFVSSSTQPGCQQNSPVGWRGSDDAILEELVCTAKEKEVVIAKSEVMCYTNSISIDASANVVALRFAPDFNMISL